MTDDELHALVKGRLPASALDSTCTRCRQKRNVTVNLSMDEKRYRRPPRAADGTYPKPIPSAPVCDVCLELWARVRDRLCLMFLAGLEVE